MKTGVGTIGSRTLVTLLEPLVDARGKAAHQGAFRDDRRGARCEHESGDEIASEFILVCASRERGRDYTCTNVAFAGKSTGTGCGFSMTFFASCALSRVETSNQIKLRRSGIEAPKVYE